MYTIYTSNVLLIMMMHISHMFFPKQIQKQTYCKPTICGIVKYGHVEDVINSTKIENGKPQISVTESNSPLALGAKAGSSLRPILCK